MTRRRAAAVAAKAGVSLALIFVLWRTIDVPASLAVMTRITTTALVTAVLLLVGLLVIAGLRWWMVLHRLDRPLPFWLAVRLTFVGMFFSQMLPTSVGGDAVRVWYARRAGVPYQPAIGSVLIERACGLFALSILVACGMLYLGSRIDPAARLALLTALPVVVAGFAVLCLADRWRWLGSIERLRPIAQFAADTRRVALSVQFLGLIAVSIVGHMIAAVMVYVLAVGLEVPLALFDALALVPAVVLTTVFPVSVAGWGVREGAMVVLLSFAGVAAEVALAISLLFGLLLIAAALPGLAFWLALRVRPAVGDVS